MPRTKLTKSAIDALPAPQSDTVYWDAALPGFGVKVTPKGRKVFIVLYRTGGAGSKLRKYTIGPYGRVTLHQARIAAQKVFTARLEGRDRAAEKREREETSRGGRSRRGSARDLHRPTPLPEPIWG
jgi:Arm DNA-binding domain